MKIFDNMKVFFYRLEYAYSSSYCNNQIDDSRRSILNIQKRWATQQRRKQEGNKWRREENLVVGKKRKRRQERTVGIKE